MLANPDDEEVGGTTSEIDLDHPKPYEPSHEDNNNNNNDQNFNERRIKNLKVLCVIVTFNICLIILFLYSAVVQGNDPNNATMWKLFYGFHAVMYSVYLVVFLAFCQQSAVVIKPLQLCYVLLIIWSVILIVTSSISMKDANNAAVPTEAGDAPQFTDTTEHAFKIAGAGIGLGAALYHYVLLLHSF